jgi:hypothetical protein
MSVSKRFLGPLYWLPIAAGIFAIFYAGVCFASYWETGNLGALVWLLYVAALGMTLLTIDFRSYAVCAANLALALLNVIVVIHSSQWPLMYLAFMCVVLAGIAALPRKAYVTERSSQAQ